MPSWSLSAHTKLEMTPGATGSVTLADSGSVSLGSAVAVLVIDVIDVESGSFTVVLTVIGGDAPDNRSVRVNRFGGALPATVAFERLDRATLTLSKKKVSSCSRSLVATTCISIAAPKSAAVRFNVSVTRAALLQVLPAAPDQVRSVRHAPAAVGRTGSATDGLPWCKSAQRAALVIVPLVIVDVLPTTRLRPLPFSVSQPLVLQRYRTTWEAI